MGKIAASGAGVAQMLGLLPDDWTQANIPTSGYQGGIPDLIASRQRVPGTYDPTRRSGSGGQRYFTDTVYTPKGQDAPDLTAQAAALQAANLANPAREIISTPTTSTTSTTADTPHWLSNYVQTGTGVSSAPAIPDISIDRTVTGRTDVPETGTPEYSDWITTQYNELPTLRRGGAVADIVKYFQGGDLVPTISQQVMTMPEIISIIRDNVPSAGPLSDEEIWAILDATSGMMGSSMRKLNAKGGKIRSGIASIMAGNPYNRSYNIGGIANGPNQFSTNLSPRPNSGDTFQGRMPSRYLDSARYGMADTIPATIDNRDPAALSGGEFVVAADVVSGLGNGNSDAGAKELYNLMDRVRQARTGTAQQGRQINPNQMMMA